MWILWKKVGGFSCYVIRGVSKRGVGYDVFEDVGECVACAIVESCFGAVCAFESMVTELVHNTTTVTGAWLCDGYSQFEPDGNMGCRSWYAVGG